jgi:hypothetical protein
MHKLINSITLLSNFKSFTVSISNATENLWLLMHFKKLRIIKKSIYYSQAPSLRSRKSTKYPTKKLNKSFENTGQLLDYLNNKCFDIRHFELEFENNFRLRITSNINVTFYSDSIEERNELIDKLIGIAGYDTFQIEKLNINIEYYFGENFSLTDCGMGISPDEFWSEEQKDKWCEAESKKYARDEEPENKRYDFYDTITPCPNINNFGMIDLV